ncbi:putative RNA-directed DNA polymerase from transposon BS [Caerostris extrusa]|uniref:RNA-directed DNA polymerase from transposon BS n=1 Tax=Caerostris extrusa TaxID=172846 RepID=A0AAV4PGJ4_CAEEX|nr:putative RNA-directed DNA polymerase from transposon BS [Caerostris extrusa]
MSGLNTLQLDCLDGGCWIRKGPSLDFRLPKGKTFKVIYKNTLTNKFSLKQGIPQGSVFSPTLFSLYTADIERELTGECEVGLFANDIVLWHFDPVIKTIEDSIDFDLGEVWTFAREYKLNFNVPKSVTWGADAATLRTTYTFLVRPILEYGFPAYSCASDTSLRKLERIQTSAAIIISENRSQQTVDYLTYSQPILQKKTGAALAFKGNREMQSAFSRFASGHIRCLPFNNKVKVFPTCDKCGLDSASPEHLLDSVNFIRVEVEAEEAGGYD